MHVKRLCPKCDCERVLSLTKSKNRAGKWLYGWLCTEGDDAHWVEKKPAGYWIPKSSLVKMNVDVENLPVHIPIIDEEKDIHLCAVCGADDVEYHHWAPSSIFDDAEEWPADFLCVKHHVSWHKKVWPAL